MTNIAIQPGLIPMAWTIASTINPAIRNNHGATNDRNATVKSFVPTGSLFQAAHRLGRPTSIVSACRARQAGVPPSSWNFIVFTASLKE